MTTVIIKLVEGNIKRQFPIFLLKRRRRKSVCPTKGQWKGGCLWGVLLWKNYILSCTVQFKELKAEFNKTSFQPKTFWNSWDVLTYCITCCLSVTVKQDLFLPIIFWSDQRVGGKWTPMIYKSCFLHHHPFSPLQNSWFSIWQDWRDGIEGTAGIS